VKFIEWIVNGFLMRNIGLRDWETGGLRDLETGGLRDWETGGRGDS